MHAKGFKQQTNSNPNLFKMAPKKVGVFEYDIIWYGSSYYYDIISCVCTMYIYIIMLYSPEARGDPDLGGSVGDILDPIRDRRAWFRLKQTK